MADKHSVSPNFPTKEVSLHEIICKSCEVNKRGQNQIVCDDCHSNGGD
jgi:hypothetical protein